MAEISKIVCIINEALNIGVFNDKRFQKADLNGVVKNINQKNSSGNVEIFPATIDNNGEAKKVYPDDKFPVSVYHKINTTQQALLPTQYGNGNNFIKRTTSMSMIVFGMKSKLKLSDNELELFIASKFPDKLTVAQAADLNLKDCNIFYTGSDLNSMTVYAREYNTKDYYLKSNHLFFEVKYTIECKLDKRCINTCKDC